LYLVRARKILQALNLLPEILTCVGRGEEEEKKPAKAHWVRYATVDRNDEDRSPRKKCVCFRDINITSFRPSTVKQRWFCDSLISHMSLATKNKMHLARKYFALLY